MIAALCAWHEAHKPTAERIQEVRALPAHVLVESYAVLTRLPGGHALTPREGSELLGRRFDQPPLRLGEVQLATLTQTLAEAGIRGGAAYDALVGLEAHAHQRLLITLDVRAQHSYAALGVTFQVAA